MMRGGQIIKKARRLRGYTQELLAERYGISRSTLQDYESGRTSPTFDVVMGILKHLRIELSEVENIAA